MISFAQVREVQARISAIQEQFGMPGGVLGMDFQKKLDKELQKAQGAGGAEKAGRVEKGAAAAKATIAAKADASAEASHAAASEAAEASQPADEPLDALVREAAAKSGVDPKLISAVAEVESGGDQSTVSGAGAVGVMQLMPETAASLGVDPYDEKENVEGGAKYIREILDAFGGDVSKAIAAYNAGPQAIREYGGVPPYRETQDYVRTVLDLYR